MRLRGLGCMRLSTDAARGDGLDILTAALDAGVTLLDTADAYCLDDTEIGHNERLIARALAGPAFAHAHGLSHALCVGTGAADRGFARRAGVPFNDLATGWPTPRDP